MTLAMIQYHVGYGDGDVGGGGGGGGGGDGGGGGVDDGGDYFAMGL